MSGEPIPNAEAFDRLANSKVPVTLGYLVELLKEVQGGIAGALKKRDERIASLEETLKDYNWVKSWTESLSRRPYIKYVGSWNSGSEKGNREGEMASHDGNVWYCVRSTQEEPGTGSDWQLAVKRGGLIEGDIESRLKNLEGRPVMVYRGVYDSLVSYAKGNFVTYQGALWHCNDSTNKAPPGEQWQLAVKAGRDAR